VTRTGLTVWLGSDRVQDPSVGPRLVFFFLLRIFEVPWKFVRARVFCHSSYRCVYMPYRLTPCVDAYVYTTVCVCTLYARRYFYNLSPSLVADSVLGTTDGMLGTNFDVDGMMQA